MVRIGSLLVLYVLLERLLVQISGLAEDSYGRPYLLAELIKGLLVLAPGPLLTLALVLAGLVVGIRRRTLGPRWSAFEKGRPLRALVVLIAFVLAWAYSTYDYNFYFDQAHSLDRLLLFALVPLLFWRPVFVFPFLVVLLAILQQFDHPIGGYSWAEQIMLGRALVLFGGFFLAFWLRGHWPTDDFLFLLCCLIAGHYWVCGYGKLQLGWILTDRIHYLLPATYANGWLGFLAPEAIGTLTSRLAAVNWPLKILTLSVECGALVCLWRRNLLRAMLAGWIVFHAGIFLATGICFWKWMVLDGAFLFLFFRKCLPPLAIFTRGHFLLSVGLIGAAAFWSHPTKLAWLDAPVTYTYRFEAIDADGRTCSLPPRFFAPYDYQFTLGSFGYLSEEAHLGIVWGAIMQPSLARALENAASPEQVQALELERGHQSFDPRRSAAFDQFIRRFAGNWNERGSERGWWCWLQAPPQLWTFPIAPAIADGQRIKQVIVYQVTSLFHGRQYAEFRKRQVRKIEVY